MTVLDPQLKADLERLIKTSSDDNVSEAIKDLIHEFESRPTKEMFDRYYDKYDRSDELKNDFEDGLKQRIIDGVRPEIDKLVLESIAKKQNAILPEQVDSDNVAENLSTSFFSPAK